MAAAYENVTSLSASGGENPERMDAFFGHIQRDVAEKLLLGCKDGTFLIRVSFSGGVPNYVLTLMTKNVAAYFQIVHNGGCWFRIDNGPCIEGIEALVSHYTKSSDGLPIKLGNTLPVAKKRFDCIAAMKWTPMHVAAYEGRGDEIKHMVFAGAPCDVVSADLETPLMLARRMGHVHVVKTLELANSGINTPDLFETLEFPFMHGSITRAAAEQILAKQTCPSPGLFLVRTKSISTKGREFVLSYLDTNGDPYHIQFGSRPPIAGEQETTYYIPDPNPTYIEGLKEFVLHYCAAADGLHAKLVRYCQNGAASKPAHYISLQQLNPPSTRFVASNIHIGKAEEAALGLPSMMGMEDEDIWALASQGVDVIKEEVATKGSLSDRQNLAHILGGTCDPKWTCAAATVEELLGAPSAKTAKLKLFHIVALRLYTTSTYASINDPLRADPPIRPHPLPATTYFISEGIKKLRAVRGHCIYDEIGDAVFWRGLKDKTVSSAFLKDGGAEFACMSTSASQSVAATFAKSQCPLVFKFVTTNFMMRGADIAFLSVYPDEMEVLYPPLTYLKPKGKPAMEDIGGVKCNVIVVEPQFPT